MDRNYARDLFQLQSELVDKKVDMAVTNAIDRVMNELSGMRKDMHSLRRDMDHQFSSLKERVTAVESTLMYVKNSQTQISTKFIDYTFKAGWLIIAGSISYIVAHFFGIIG